MFQERTDCSQPSRQRPHARAIIAPLRQKRAEGDGFQGFNVLDRRQSSKMADKELKELTRVAFIGFQRQRRIALLAAK